jgi:GNAT superfamily N-acetyltransferase
VIRRAGTDDLPAIGEVFLAARDEMAYLPRVQDQDRPRIGELITAGRGELWVAERDGRVVAFAAVGDAELEHLYVEPASQSTGIGTALLEHAKSRRPAGFTFWVFQKNEGARRFYERHGCTLLELTDGAANMEREPDALYEWRPGAADTDD